MQCFQRTIIYQSSTKTEALTKPRPFSNIYDLQPGCCSTDIICKNNKRKSSPTCETFRRASPLVTRPCKKVLAAITVRITLIFSSLGVSPKGFRVSDCLATHSRYSSPMLYCGFKALKSLSSRRAQNSFNASSRLTLVPL